MKKLFAALLLALHLLPALAQTFPPVPANPPASLSGQALRDWLRQNWYDGKRNVLSYSQARAKMYNYADNYNNSVTCVYSGYNTPVPLSFTSSSTSSAANINCEHSIPQSWFSSANRMVSDMHHLYPTYIQWNSNRGNNPYYEIPDATTTIWMRNTTGQATIPTTLIDEYSEATTNQFEPREDHKGNLARTAFYFYTMHDTQPELIATGHQAIGSIADINTLYRWHLADPVDAHEIERNRRVAASQGNYNPYILHPELVALAYGLAAPGPVITFAAASSSQAEGNNANVPHTVSLTVSPAPTSPLTVQVNVDATNSTATNGTDFTFTSPTTVTFAAGQTTATVSVVVVGDVTPEADETVALTLTNPGTGASVGSPSGHVLTILNDDGTPTAVQFAAATGTIVEGNSGTTTYSVSLVLTGGSTGSFSVPVSVSVAGTSASTPSDYVLNTTSVTFGGIVPPQPITITVNGDLTAEPDETVRLVLGTPSNPNVLLGTPNTHILTIISDDPLPVGQPCEQLFFTQYIEGSASNTKALEIFNPSDIAMPLAGKRIELFANGAIVPTSTQALTGSIAPGDVYVIANTGVVNAAVAAAADIQSAVAFFNGNDAVVLYDGTDTLDIIGVVGQNPTSWTTAGGGSTLNNTLVRLPSTALGGRWNGPNGSATWTPLGTDDYTGIGSYTSTACVVTGTRPATRTLRDGLELYPNPAHETLRLRLPGVTAPLAATVEVLDNLGRVLRQRPAILSATAAAQLDLHGLPAGLYAVRVVAGDVVYTGRVVVE